MDNIGCAHIGYISMYTYSTVFYTIYIALKNKNHPSASSIKVIGYKLFTLTYKYHCLRCVAGG